MKKSPLVLFLLLAAGAAFPISVTLEQAESLYQQNKPAEAKPLLEAALSEDPTDEKIYLWLGVTYRQLEDLDKAIAVLKRGLAIAADYKAEFYWNIGLVYFSQKQFTFADNMFTSAIATDRKYTDAYKDRAQARMKLENYDGALADYTLFLQLAPQDPQRPQIEALIALLTKTLEARANKQKEEEARQKALMNDVLNSLNNASEDTKNLSVESLQIKHDAEDVDIKD